MKGAWLPVVAAIGVVVTSCGATPSWRQLHLDLRGVYLLGTAAGSSSDAWAVGFRTTLSNDRGWVADAPVAERLLGGRWSLVPVPFYGANAGLNAVAVVSTSDAWAVGRAEESGNGFVAYWNGTVWRSAMPVPAPAPGSHVSLNAVAARSSNDVWAVGSLSMPAPNVYAQIGPGVAAHWDGKQWATAVLGAQSGSLNGVVELSTNDVWAVGTDGDAMIAHWDGLTWSTVQPGQPHGELDSIAEVAPNDLWAVGVEYENGGKRRPLIEHWQDGRWVVVPAGRASGVLRSVSGTAAVNVWAVGATSDEASGQDVLVLHWDGKEWTPTMVPRLGGTLNGVAAEGDGLVVAVGAAGTPNEGGRILIATPVA